MKKIVSRASIDQNLLRDEIFLTLDHWHDEQMDQELALLHRFHCVREMMHTADLASPNAFHHASKAVIEEAVASLDHPQLSLFFQYRFEDKKNQLEIVSLLNLKNRDEAKRMQNATLKRLADIIAARENNLRNELKARFKHRLLSKTYDKLVGADDLLPEVTSCVLDSRAHFLISLSGIGGIGKTSLADAAARQVIETAAFYGFAWWRVSDESKEMVNGRLQLTQASIVNGLINRLELTIPYNSSAAERYNILYQTLKREPHFIVIDNVETEANAAIISDILVKLANPSKFLVTTRFRLSDKPSIYRISVNEKSTQDAGQILRNYGKANNLTQLAEATAEQLAPIINIVGGNPLALKLVGGLIRWRSLSEILDDMVEAFSTEVKDMYAYIYRKAWNSLSENGRNLLEVMPLVGEHGGTIKQLLFISEMSRSDLTDALQELDSRSLLESRQHIDLWEQSYGIHRLTEAFLKTEIIHWFEEEQ